MASVTLSESAKLAQDDLVAGVIEDVITVNQSFQVLPFDGITGNALKYNREVNVDDLSAPAGVGTDLTANADYKRAATFASVTASLTKILGDAEVDNLIQATRSGDGNDQKLTQIASKAKSIGREYQRQLISGDGNNNEFTGLLVLGDVSSQKATTPVNGQNISFEVLDELQDLVTDKDGHVDYYMMNARTRRSYRTLLRAMGGNQVDDMVELPSGDKVMAYSQVPIFRNDYIPTNQTYGASNNTTTVFAGTFDDGSRSHGVAGLTAEEAAGIWVTEVGVSETKDETITRVGWYCGLAQFSQRGLAIAEGIKN
jgi:hypothetical protein